MLALEQQWLASGLPVAALMETVGQRMADWCLKRPERLHHGVLVLVGPGHNGGDGLVLGRKLLEAMIQAEQDEPNFCLPPVMLADDDVVTQPFAVAAE